MTAAPSPRAGAGSAGGRASPEWPGTPTAAVGRVLASGVSLRRLVPTQSTRNLAWGEPASPTAVSDPWGYGPYGAPAALEAMGIDPATAARSAVVATRWGDGGGAPSSSRGMGIGGGNNGAEDGSDPTADLGGVRDDPLRLPSLAAPARAPAGSAPAGDDGASWGPDGEVVAASGAAAVVFAGLMDALSPALAAVGGPACAQQCLVDYVELKRKLVQFTRTSKRQEVIRRNRSLRQQGLETEPIDADAIEAGLPKAVHARIRRLARQVAAMQRIAGEAVRLHGRLCRLEGAVVDSAAETALAEALAAEPQQADEAGAITAAGFRSGLLTREQRRVLLADATARLQAHAVTGSADA